MVEITCPFCGNKFDPGMGFGDRMIRILTDMPDVVCSHCHMKMPGQHF